MPIKLMRSLFLVMAALACASLAYGQTGAIRGKVIGKDGQPLQGALIKIERQQVRGNYKVKSRKKGDFFHAGLPLGIYNVSCEIDGQIVERMGNVRVGLSDPAEVNALGIYNSSAWATSRTRDPAEVNFDLQKLAARRRGPTQADLASMSAEERKRYEQAIRSRQQAISKNKELNETFNDGMVALKMENYPAAVQSLTKASALDASQHVIWANLGEAQAKMALSTAGAGRSKLYGESIASYDKAIEIDATNAAYHNNLGLVMVRAGKIDDGKMKLAEAAMLDPGNAAKYFFNLGAVMVNTANTEGAIQAFTKATEANPNYAHAYYQLGMALVGNAETQPDGTVVPADGTLEAFEKYIELEPQGQFTAAAQSMLTGLSASVETQYEDTTKKKKKRRRRKKSS